QKVESQLQPAAREHCHVASWKYVHLLLMLTDGHCATRLRYHERRLLRHLQAMEVFIILTINCLLVQTPTPPWHQVGPAPELSSLEADNIQETARCINDPMLRAALERLASHARPDVSDN